MVEEYLSQKGVDFEERDVSENQAYAEELVRTTGQMGVPVTLINGQTVIGFDRPRLEQALSQAQKASLGATVADAGKMGGAVRGAYIGNVKAGSAAVKMGLTAGDIIVEVNKQPINSAADLERALSRLSQGSRISLVFVRDNQRLGTEGKL
jgi:S1-C subfamily serine protease